MENGRVSVFSLSRKGSELEKEKAFEELEDFLVSNNYKLPPTSSLELSYKEKDPDITIDSIESMGIKSLIGQGKSNFRGSPRNRIHNITVATSRFDGLLIKPG
jgi:vancomycin resistance protein YoaR